MADSSFDIVSKYDKQEVANAVNTAAKEIANRYDFKGVGARVELAGEVIKIEANTEERCKAVLDVVQTWLDQAGRLAQAPRRPRGRARGCRARSTSSTARSRRASPPRTRRRSRRSSATRGRRAVKTQIQGDEVRVTSKSRDDLQAVQRLLKEQDLDVALQFTNYR